METSRKAKKEREIRSNGRVLLTIFFDCVVHHEFLPQGRAVNKEHYLEVMRQLRKSIRPKRTEWLEKPIIEFAP